MTLRELTALVLLYNALREVLQVPNAEDFQRAHRSIKRAAQLVPELEDLSTLK
jgi:hypothetical protein